jgi:XapX domain-containing protein
VPYLQVAAVALLVGAVYAVIHVRSPAPPLIAIVGLAGMLVMSTILEALG